MCRMLFSFLGDHVLVTALHLMELVSNLLQLNNIEFRDNSPSLAQCYGHGENVFGGENKNEKSIGE